MIIMADGAVSMNPGCIPDAGVIVCGEMVQLTTFGSPTPEPPAVSGASLPVTVLFEQIVIGTYAGSQIAIIPSRWRYKIMADGWLFPGTAWSGTVTWTQSAGANGRICTGVSSGLASVVETFTSITAPANRDKATTYKTILTPCHSCCDISEYP